MKNMKLNFRHSLRFFQWGFLAVVLSLMALTTRAVVVYQTGFEASEGYNTNGDLVGQKGWVGAGSGGNGVTSGFFPGRGQQAYIGFYPPATNDSSLFVYQPINKSISQMQFQVTLAILDSSNSNWDDFYWSLYNQRGQQLFTLDLDNFELNVYYRLDGTNSRTWSGLTFSNSVAYRLSVSLDFAHNLWSATFGGAMVATNQPITTTGAPLDMGDFDGAWVIYDPTAPGNNFMVFDDYLITASVPQPQLKLLGLLNGSTTLRLTGLTNSNFALDTSTNCLNWLPLKTNLTSGGFFDYVDDAAVGQPRRFYRGRWVP